MSRDEIAKKLRGTRKEVESAVEAIQVQFNQIRKGGTSSVTSYALRYEVGILRQICCALQDNYYKYADLYCEIAASMLPHVEPCSAKPELWVNHLTSLHYIHHALCREQTVTECQRLYALVNTQCVRLQSKTDYKFYMNIHIKHLYFFSQQMQKQSTSTAEDQLCSVLQGFGALFQAMQQHSTASYGELIDELNQILGKRSNSFLKILGKLPVAYSNKMFQPLFKLLSSSGGTSDELITQFPQYLSALLALIQIDGYAWQQEAAKVHLPLALQLLRCCRDSYQQLKSHNYVIQLLYYYLKLLYTRESSQDLKRHYIDLAKKFINTFEQKGAAHAQEQWFIDFLLVFIRVQKLLHQMDGKTSCFEIFWQGMGGKNSAEPYAAHFELINCLISTSMNISSSSPLAATCNNDAQCQSLRKHCIFTLGCCAVVAYSNWHPTEQATLPKPAQKILVSIIHYAMDVVKVIKCMMPTSVEMVNFVWHLTNIADKVATATQMSLLQMLLKPLQQLRPLVGEQEMRQLLRRIYKASSYCDNQELAAQMQCTYIAAITCPARQYQQMCFYYRTAKNLVPKCIFELHEMSPLCNPLTTAEKRKLYELDMLAVPGNKKMTPLLQSLLRHRQTDYHLVLLGRQMRTDTKMLQQFEELRLKLQHSNMKRLTRLEKLVLAHVNVAKLLVSLEVQKTKIPIKETAEKSLEEVLVKHKLLDLNIASEIPLMELATTALDAFEAFYNQADAEPLSSDEALIDWEALIDDAIVTAMALSTMGYIPQADKAWLLLLRISRMLGESFTFLRALSHFMSRYVEHPEFDMSVEVEYAQQLLDDLWPQIHSAHFFKRQHTTLMLCLCQMALYYARLDCMLHAQLLLQHVDRLRDQFEERVGKCDIVQLSRQAVQFRICYQQRQCSILASMPTSLQLLDTLADSVRNFSSISSLDHGVLVLLLSDLVRDSTECTANRLSERPNLSSSLLQVLLQSGLVLRTVEVLVSWLWTNLQMECLDKALSKLRLIEHFLCIKPLSPTQPISKSTCLLTVPMDAQSKHMSELVGKMLSMQLEQHPANVEPIRKQQQLELSSPRLKMQPPSANRLKLQCYLEEAHPVMRDNIQFQCIYFIVGCLHARLKFLNREHDQLDDFYTTSNDWLQQNPDRSHALGHMLLVQRVYQSNYFRAKQKHRQAMEITKSALELANSEQLQQRTDVNYRYNLLLQLRTTQLELHPQLGKKVQQLPRRALKFNKSPEDQSKTKSKVSKKSPRFHIYTEDSGSSSGSSMESNSSPEESKRFDLDACQIIETIDLSDEDPSPPPPSVKPLPRSAQTARSTRTRTQKQLETPLGSTRRMATTPNALALSRIRRRNELLEESEPKTTTVTRGRPRRQNAVEDQAVTPLQKSDSVSSRRRQRN